MSTDRNFLQSLPTELLLQVYEYLPPAARITVPYICRRFYCTFHAYDPVDTLEKDELYKHLILMERDGFRSKTISCCSGCETFHSNGLFIDKELRSFEKRFCLLSAKLIWINPTTQFSFNELSRLKFSGRFEEVSGVKALKTSVRRRCGDVALVTFHEICSFPRESYVSKEYISTLLKGFDLPTCPHTRLSDSAVVEAYNAEATVIETPFAKNAPFLYDVADGAGECRQSGCQTRFYWSIHVNGENQEMKSIYVHIHRALGDFNEPFNPTWMAQVASPNLPVLGRVWNECHQWREEYIAVEKRRYELELAAHSSYESQRGRQECEIRQLKNRVNQLYHPHRSSLYPFLETDGNNTKSRLQELDLHNDTGKEKFSDTGPLDNETRHSESRSVTPNLRTMGHQPNFENDDFFFPLFQGSANSANEFYEMLRQNVREELGLSPSPPESVAHKSRASSVSTFSNTISRALYSFLWG